MVRKCLISIAHRANKVITQVYQFDPIACRRWKHSQPIILSGKPI